MKCEYSSSYLAQDNKKWNTHGHNQNCSAKSTSYVQHRHTSTKGRSLHNDNMTHVWLFGVIMIRNRHLYKKEGWLEYYLKSNRDRIPYFNWVQE